MATDAEIIETMKEGFEILCTWSRNIAMLPLEDWDAAFERSESVGHILDPTLYRDYLYSDKAKTIRAIIKAAIPLKQEILKAQPLALAEMRGEKVR